VGNDGCTRVGAVSCNQTEKVIVSIVSAASRASTAASTIDTIDTIDAIDAFRDEIRYRPPRRQAV